MLFITIRFIYCVPRVNISQHTNVVVSCDKYINVCVCVCYMHSYMWISFHRKNDDNNLLFDIGCVLLARIMYNKSYKVKCN